MVCAAIHDVLGGAASTPSCARLAAVATVAKLAGLGAAKLLEHPRLAPARALVASRASLRPLLSYADGWLLSIVTETSIVLTEWLVLATVDAALPRIGASLRAAAAISDAATVAPYPRLIRLLASPLPTALTSRAGLTRLVLPKLTRQHVLALAAAQMLRTTIRTACVLALRHVRQGDLYLRPAGVAVQAAGHGLLSGCVTAFAANNAIALLASPRSRQPHAYSVWVVVYGLNWAAASAVAARLVSELNARCARWIKKWLYRPLPGPRNSRQRVFDLQELDDNFGRLSATELSEISQFATEALRSASIDQNTRLHAVRFLASLTEYVRAVNNGALTRASHIPSAQSLSHTTPPHSPVSAPTDAVIPLDDVMSSPASLNLSASRQGSSSNQHRQRPPFESHVFTAEQISERLRTGGEPFQCARCRAAFKPKEKAYRLPCGHLLHRAGRCAVLVSDWCPKCTRPTATPSTDERMAVFIGMKSYVERLAHQWENIHVLPKRLHYAEWSYVAQYARRHRCVEGEAPLDVVPADLVPGVHAILDLPLAATLWALRLQPTESTPRLFTASDGW